jgi:hypothetical protein
MWKSILTHHLHSTWEAEQSRTPPPPPSDLQDRPKTAVWLSAAALSTHTVKSRRFRMSVVRLAVQLCTATTHARCKMIEEGPS